MFKIDFQSKLVCAAAAYLALMFSFAAEACGTGGNLHPLRIYYATNRSANFEGGNAPQYGGAPSATLSYGSVEVDFVEFAPSPARAATVRLGAPSQFADEYAFAAALRRNGVVPLVFVHGFDETFERAVTRLAQIVHDGCLDVAPVLFSWPSHGSLLGYSADKSAALASAPRLANVLTVIVQSSRTPIDVMAHSMGNLVLLDALDVLRASGACRSQCASRLILASPDVDVGDFRTHLAAVRSFSRRSYLLTSRYDFMLGLSSVLNATKRVGDMSPSELAAVGISSEGTFEVVQLDQALTGECLEGSHRCSESNPVVLAGIRRVLSGSGQSFWGHTNAR